MYFKLLFSIDFGTVVELAFAQSRVKLQWKIYF